MHARLPRIIQGGMGVSVSSWPLACAVSRRGQLGVVSGTGIDTVVITENGVENFTDFLPSELADLEKLTLEKGVVQKVGPSAMTHP